MRQTRGPSPDRGSDRISWADSPLILRQEVQTSLHKVGLGTIRDSTSIAGGFSPGVVERLTLDDGRSIFFKASSTDLNPVTPTLHLGEARLLQSLPSTIPCARWIATIEVGAWGGLVTEFLDGGNPVLPVTPESVRRMIGVVDQLAELGPVDLPMLRPLESLLSGGYWMGAQKFLDSQPCRPHEVLVSHTESFDWLMANLPGVVAREQGLASAVRGTVLLHRDLRTDNVIASPTRGFVPVDWAWACIGSPVFELVGMLTSLRFDGGPPPWEAMEQSVVGRTAPLDQVRSTVAGVLGYFLWASVQPPPPGIGHVRPFQARLALICIDWMRFLEQT